MTDIPKTDGPFLATAGPVNSAQPAPPPIHEGKLEGPFYNFVYFFEDGGVSRLNTREPDSILMQQAYLVMVSVPKAHNQAPFVEIIKSRYGPSSVILTGNANQP